MEHEIFWTSGDRVQYTGKSYTKHGAKWFEYVILGGYEKGQTRATSRCPDCKLCHYNNQPAYNVCTCCEVSDN